MKKKNKDKNKEKSNSKLVSTTSSKMAVTSLMESGNLIYSPDKSKPLVKKDGDSDHIKWGDDDDEPQKVIESLNESPILNPKIHWMAKAVASGVIEVVDLDTDEVVLRSAVPEIYKLLNKSKRYVRSAFVDLFSHGMVFSKIYFDEGNVKALKVGYSDASFCRFAAVTKARSESILINANLANNGKISDPETVKLPTIDVDNQPEYLPQTKTDKNIWAWTVGYPTPGRSFYMAAPWHPLRETWLPIAKAILEMKTAILENAISLKNLIEVPSDFWEWKYPKWDTFGANKRLKLIEKEHKLFDDYLSGKENAGKSLMTTFRVDPATAKEYGRFKITSIDDKLDGLLKQDTHEANSHILAGLNLDPSLAGIIPGTSQAGSGSKDRNAFNIFLGVSKLEQDIILEPLQFCLEYNGYEQYGLRFNHKFLTMLSEVSPNKRDGE